MSMPDLEELHSFHNFLGKKLAEPGTDVLSPEEALDLWRLENPTPQEHAAAVDAIREGLEDMRAGRLQPARDVLAELQRKHNVPDVP